MKTIIFQYWIGNIPKWAEICIAKFKQYAEMHNADYIFDNVARFSPTNPYFEHLRILHDPKFEEYDKVLFLDVDIFPEIMEENIFDEPIKDIGAIPERTQPNRLSPSGNDMPKKLKEFKNGCAAFDIPVVKPTSTKDSSQLMMNSGVLLWSQEGIQKAKKTFLDWRKWNARFSGQMALDQTYITGQMVKHLDYTELPYKWNCSPRIKFAPEHVPSPMNFVHYTGKKKYLIEELYNA